MSSVRPDEYQVGAEEKGIDDLAHVEDPNTEELVVDADAKGFVDHTLVVDEATNRRLLRMINWRVLPCMCLCYLGQGLDKGAIGTASIMGLQKDTGMVGQDYALATTTFWAGLIIAQFPANRLVQILPLGKFMAGSLVLWGITLIIMAVAKSAAAILALRALLGVFESVCGPVLLAMSVMWYRRSEQPSVVNFYQAFVGVSTVISSLLGYGFYQVQGGKLLSWQYVFLIIAAVSILLGAVVFTILPDSPPKATCWSEHDRKLMVERVRVNDQGIKNPKWNWDQFYEAIKDVYVYMLFGLTFMNATVVGGIGTFSNLLVNQAFGFDVLHAQLLSMPTGTVIVLIYALTAWIVTKTNQTIYVLLGLAVFNWAGTITLITVAPSASTRGGLLVAFYILQCYQGQNPLIFQLCSRNVAGQTKRTVAYAASFAGWAGGNAIGPLLFYSGWAPRYLNTLYIHLAFYGAHAILIVATRLLLVQRNKKKEAAMPPTGDASQHLHAFEDLTDRQNPDFRYIM
ncbi:hypothetical protein JCM24511_06187 [Saitozyma sp. JCM 24511]|nr:hypothetical protein JCM24511_06187 [Saitozyma sp. JCM 24511]